MNVWVVSKLYIMDSELETKVFSDENSACEYACNVAKKRMDYCCNDDDYCKDDKESYEEFNDFLSQKKYDEALDIYCEYVSELDYEYQMYIHIHEHTIEAASDLDVPVTAPALPDVPCKQCRQNVNVSDKVCWYCGVIDPAVDSHRLTKS